MLVFFTHRNAVAESLYLSTEPNPDGNLCEGSFVYEDETFGPQELFRIPLERGVSEKDVSISNNIADRCLTISLPAGNKDFYYLNSLSGSREHISKVTFDISETGVRFELSLDTSSEPTAIFANNSLYLKFSDPQELYKRVILIDAGHGGDDTGTTAYGLEEKTVTLAVSERISTPEDADVKLYRTRTDDSSVPNDERLSLAKSVKPDLIITLHTGSDPDTRITRGCSVLYSDPALRESAEALSASIAGATGLPDLGAMQNTESSPLLSSGFPCLLVRLGTITNRSEALQISEDTFIQNAAEAITGFLKE